FAVWARAGFSEELSKVPPPARTQADSKQDWWSFKATKRPQLPKIKKNDWARNPIDVFILSKLEREQLSPSVEADRRTLIRRLSFDLTGLPPRPEEIERFVAD